MLYQIRRGCFESNSSSMHSIVVTKNDVNFDPDSYPEHWYIRNDGVAEVAWGEEDLDFGRYPFEILCTFRDKLRYVIADFCQYNEHAAEEFKKIQEVVCKFFPKIKKLRLPTRSVEIIKDIDGNEINERSIHYNYDLEEDDPMRHYYIKDGKEYPVTYTGTYKNVPYYGYVDHQSMGIVKNFLKAENITLEEFLSNRKYIIIIDGDEYCVWDTIKYSGLLNSENIVKESSDSREDHYYEKAD